MSSSLARTRSLRKPTQGSSTDLPPTSTSNSTSTSTVNTAAAAPAPAPPTTSTQRPVSPSRLPAPRSLAATRPTTRSVSGASVASTKSGASDAAAAAAKKKRANPLSTLLSRPASTRQTPGTTSATRPRDAAAAAGGPPSAPPSRTNALPDQAVLHARTCADTATTPPRPIFILIIHPSRRRHRHPIDDRNHATHDVGRRTLLEAHQRCVFGDLESHKGPRARKERRHPQREHHPPPARSALRVRPHHEVAPDSLAPKPLTATYLAPPSPSKLPSNVALSAETARLQTELLQLHLLHRDLPQTTAAWHASARDKLAARHASLGRSAADLARQEAEAAERLNIAALRRWGSHRHHSSSSSSSPATIAATTLEDKIQRLDALLASLWSLDTPGGKHHRLVRAFERWASALPDLEAARARAEDQGDPEALLDADSQVRFGGALDARWKEDAAALVRKLEGWRAQLRELEYRDEEESDDDGDGGDGDGGKTRVSSRSSLERLLDGCGSLIRDMLDELAVMEEIEAVAVEREAEWIRRMNRQGEDGRGKDTPRAGAVWRVV
ncbi:hypothetical protein ColKHC_04041 [Colletotrichum higginsianum]|nr:hypothetical protein ColKHC_04041 [Colletotrichum higginsianum]